MFYLRIFLLDTRSLVTILLFGDLSEPVIQEGWLHIGTLIALKGLFMENLDLP